MKIFFKNATASQIYARLFTVSLAMLPLVGFFSARSISILPGVIAVVFGALWSVYYKEKLTLSRPFFGWVAFILILCGLSTFWSPEFAFAWGKIGKIAAILIPGALLFSIANSLKPEDTKILACKLPVFLSIGCLLVALELALGLPFHRFIDGYDWAHPLSHAVVNRSIFCALSTIFICIGSVRAANMSQDKTDLMLGIPFLMAAAMLALSESQSNQLAVLLGGIMLVAFPYKLPKLYYGLAALMSVLILAAPWIAIWMFHQLAAGSENAPFLKEGFAANRMEIWDFVSRHIIQNPFKGYGVESTRFMTFETRKLFFDGNTVLHPHNFVLELWGEFGLAGALSGCLFFTYLFHRIAQMPKAAAKIAFPTLAYAGTVGVIGYGVWQGWWLGQLMVLLALFALAARQQPEN